VNFGIITFRNFELI